MFQPLSVALTYFEPCPNVGTDDAQLRDAFHRNWQSRGWSHVQLDRPTADRHPLAATFADITASLPTTNWPDYEAASWRRYLALAQWFHENPSQAHALFLDYDIWNHRLFPVDLLPHAAANGITLLTASNPEAFGAILLNRHAASTLPALILAVAPQPELIRTLPDGRPHISDFIFLQFLRDWAHIAANFSCQQLFHPDLLNSQDPPSMPLVHISNAISRFHPSLPTPRASAFNALVNRFP